jgi:hypothetical protein
MKTKVLICIGRKEEEGKKKNKNKNLMTFTTNEMKFETESENIDLEAFKIYLIAQIEDIVIQVFPSLNYLERPHQ